MWCLGDCNVDFNRARTHGHLLSAFCENNNLHADPSHDKYSVDYSYHFNMGFSTLDHFIVSGAIFDTAVESVNCQHGVIIYLITIHCFYD